MYGGYVTREKDPANLSDEELLIAVANTGHVEHDELTDALSVRAWWGEIVGSASARARRPVGPDGLVMLRDLRGLIRRLALRHNGIETVADTAHLERIGLRLDLRGSPSLRSVEDGDLAEDICAAGIAALLRASARPGWPRFKACRGEDCRWVFVDSSRNSSRRWCDMAGCGNRAKVTSFRRRQRAG
jgi:predicted RNA-binding Zn ribbon-like protein